MSCWEKAHKFYMPKGLFHDTVHPLVDGDLKDIERGYCPRFQCLRVGSDICKMRNTAFGIENNGRGRKKAAGKKARAKSDQVVTSNAEDSDDDGGLLGNFGTLRQEEGELEDLDWL